MTANVPDPHPYRKLASQIRRRRKKGDLIFLPPEEYAFSPDYTNDEFMLRYALAMKEDEVAGTTWKDLQRKYGGTEMAPDARSQDRVTTSKRGRSRSSSGAAHVDLQKTPGKKRIAGTRNVTAGSGFRGKVATKRGTKLAPKKGATMKVVRKKATKKKTTKS